MRILSLFDGISGGQVALTKRLGLKDYTYLASEIDRYAIEVTQKQFPNTIQLGDVTKIKAEHVGEIDLLIGGSPCQSFSKSYSQSDRGFDGSSQLFWEYVRILREVKPKHFFLENVKMKQEYVDIISEALGVQPIEVNSSIFSGCQRNRMYWTNIFVNRLPQANDKSLSDYIDFDEQGYRLSAKIQDRYQTLEEANHKLVGHHSIVGTTSPPFRTIGQRDYVYGLHKGSLMGCLLASDYKQPKQIILADGAIRKLSPRECEALMGLPKDYTANISDTQRYKAIGNGWQIDTAAFLLSSLMKDLVYLEGKYADINTLEVEGVDTSDYPDFCDAYLSYGEYVDGEKIEEDNLALLDESHPDLAYERAVESIS